MLPKPRFNFKMFKSLDIILKHKRIQKQVTYFCTQSLGYIMEAIIYNFNIMRSLSKQYLNQATKDSDSDCTTSILYSAFALEAYLNYAGEKLFNCWHEIEKSLKPIAKVKLIC